MEKRTSEEAERIIKMRNERYFKHRVQRLIEFGKVAGTVRLSEVTTVTYDTEKAPPIHYLQSYIDEAQDSYVAGNFRSCIFCCAAAVEQVIKYELIKSSSDLEAEIKEIENKVLGLGRLVGRLKECPSGDKRISRLKKFSGSFYWINDARNTIAVHPSFASVYRKEDTEEMKIWKNERMIKNIKEILALLSGYDREKILGLNVKSPEGRSITLRELLDDPKSQHTPEVWDAFIRRDVFQQHLALEAFRKMKEIIEGVYPS